MGSRAVSMLMALCLSWGAAQAAAPDALRARFESLRERAGPSVFDRPVYLVSSETTDRMQGDFFAVVDFPYDELRRTLARAEPWCGILILHLNVKYCRSSNDGSGDYLDVGIGRKFDQPLANVHWVRFAVRVGSAGEGYFDIVLQAPGGPFGTHDFRIVVEAVPTQQQTLLHLTYAYAYGVTARWAMQAYLATIGSDKVGFSILGRQADGQPVLVKGLRGVLERNTVRYYLAIETYLAASKLPPPQQLQRSLEDWFSATEHYPRQLHEVERQAYIEMKLHEVARQQRERPPARP